MKNVKQKRPRGRPATGRTPIIGLRLSADEIQLVDELAAEEHIDRSKALRILLREGLAAHTRKKRRDAAAQRRVEAANAELVAEVLAERDEPEPPPPMPRRRPGFRRPPTREEVKAAADRAEQKPIRLIRE